MGLGFAHPAEGTKGDGRALALPRPIHPIPTPHGPVNFGTAVPPNVLLSGMWLTPGQQLTTLNGRATLTLQSSDGNLVERYGNLAVWDTVTAGMGVVKAIMQTDGNFVLYDRNGRAVWESNTAGNAGASLTFQNDGNIVITHYGRVLWSSFGNPSMDGVVYPLNGLGALTPNSGQDPTPGGTAGDSAAATNGTSTTTYVVAGLSALALGALAWRLHERAPARRR
jgi:hypothetical protein